MYNIHCPSKPQQTAPSPSSPSPEEAHQQRKGGRGPKPLIDLNSGRWMRRPWRSKTYGPYFEMLYNDGFKTDLLACKLCEYYCNIHSHYSIRNHIKEHLSSKELMSFTNKRRYTKYVQKLDEIPRKVMRLQQEADEHNGGHKLALAHSSFEENVLHDDLTFEDSQPKLRRPLLFESTFASSSINGSSGTAYSKQHSPAIELQFDLADDNQIEPTGDHCFRKGQQSESYGIQRPNPEGPSTRDGPGSSQKREKRPVKDVATADEDLDEKAKRLKVRILEKELEIKEMEAELLRRRLGLAPSKKFTAAENNDIDLDDA